VESSIQSLKRVSLAFDQAIYCQRDGQEVLVNRAEVQLACVHSETFKPIPIPDSILRKLSDHE
jgi:acyl-CoA thioesterase FadM